MRTGNNCCTLFLLLLFAHSLAAQPPVWDSVKAIGNNRFAGYKNSRCYLLNAAREPVTTKAYEALRNFSGKLAAAKRESRWGFVNAAGEEPVPLRFGAVGDFAQGRAMVCEGDACQWVNEEGATVLPTPQSTPSFQASLASQQRQYAEDYRVFGNQRSASTLPCPPNIDFETGSFQNWQTNVGYVSAFNASNVIDLPAAGWISNGGTPLRHTLQDRSTTVPSADYYGHFPVNPATGGRYSLKLGGDDNLGVCGSAACPNARAEAARYVINVPAAAANYSITFSYAVVLENPLAGLNLHKDYEQPRFTVKMYDPATNEVIPCANFTFVASGPLPGFDTSDVKKSADAVVRVKNWSSVYVNLSKYAGRTFYLEFTTADCTKGGHFGYAYVDVTECGIAAKSQTRCAPVNLTTLYGPPGFQGYQWYNENFTQLLGTTQNVVINPAPPVGTKYWVVATPYPNTGCPTCDCRDTVKVEVQPNFPDANAGPDRSLCPGGSASIGTPAVPGLTYQWSPATGLADAAAATTLTTGAVPQYVLRVTDTFGCSITDTVNVTVWPKPVAAFLTANKEQCLAGNKFSFANTSSISNGTTGYQWSFGDGASSTQKDAEHSYATAGKYTVVLKVVSEKGCEDSVSQEVTVHPPPVLALAGKEYTLCRGSNASLQASGADRYTWSPAQQLSCTSCANPLASPSASRVYYVEGISNAGCRASDSVRITVVQPFVLTTQDDTLCLGDTVQLQARGADRYLWSPATGLSNVTVSSPVASPKQSITYTVVGYDNQGCFTDTAYAKLLVAPLPSVVLDPALTVSTGSTVTLSSTSSGDVVRWLWSPRSALSCSICPVPVAEVKADVVYRVVVTNAFGCVATDSIAIKAFCAEGQVYIPNAFTPDGDGVNDLFFVQGRGISLVKTFRIFNRWGELLFEKRNVAQPNDARQGWDGKIRGVAGPPDVFVYTAEVVCSNGAVFFFKGNVSVLK